MTMLNVCVCRGDAGERCSACGLLVTTPPKLPGLKEAWPEEKKLELLCAARKKKYCLRKLPAKIRARCPMEADISHASTAIARVEWVSCSTVSA